MEEIMKMSAPVPRNFNANDADNLEDVKDTIPAKSHSSLPPENHLLILISLADWVFFNLQKIEKQFAVKGQPSQAWEVVLTTTSGLGADIFSSQLCNISETYWSILEKVKGSSLRLTRIDDDIYEHLKADFPDFDPAKTINESEMKSKVGKERWRKFMMAYENKVDDYNFGTMLRTDPKSEYEQDTTIFVPRMQFYAVEIARNRSGLNDWIYEKAQADKAAKQP